MEKALVFGIDKEIGGLLVVVFLGIVMVSWIFTQLAMQLWGGYQARFTAAAESRLERMFLFLDYKKVFLTNVGLLLVLPLAVYLYFGSVFLAIVTLIVILCIPKMMLKRMQSRRKHTIINALPDALAQIAGSLRSGATFTAAIETLVNESKGPVAQEFGLMLKEQKLGISPREALENLAERVTAEEMDLVVAAALIAREVGGNLAEIFERLSTMLRKKIEMEGKINALTSQGKLQGWVVGFLPLAIIAALVVIEPEGILPVFSTFLGWGFLTVILIMEIFGAIMIRKIVSIEV